MKLIYSTLILFLSFICIMSCSEKEDENKIAILKETQDELIHQCKMQENQLKVKYVGNQSIKIYLTISQKLNSYIFSVLDTTNSNSNLTLDDKKNQKEYFNVLNTERSTYKHNIYFPSDDSVIYNKRFDQLELQNEGRIENKLLSNIYILNTHLKILRLNGSCAALGCNLGVNQLGYGTTTIYDGLDSTKIFAHYTFPWKKAAIKTMKFARLENENGEIVHSINHKNLLDNKMEVSSRKLNKGKYNLTITFEYIIENGDERSEEISFPIEIYK